MVLPVTISPSKTAAQSSYHGPFKSSEAAFYTILVDASGTGDSLEAYKAATDPADGFSEQDAANGPILGSGTSTPSCNAFQAGDDLHVAAQQNNNQPYYSRFDMLNDIWDNIDGAGDRDILIDSATILSDNIGCDIAALSTGKIRVVYQGQREMDMGGNFSRVDESHSVDSGETWSAPTQIDDGAVNAGVHFTGPRIILPPSNSDQCHILMVEEGGADDHLGQRAIASDDTLRSYRDTASHVTVHPYVITHGIGFLRSSVSKVRIGFREETGIDLKVMEFDAFTGDENRWSGGEVSSTVSTDNVDIFNSSIIACLATDGSTIRGLMSKVTGRDLFEFDDGDSDTYTLQGTAHVVGSLRHVSCNVYDRSGPKLAMIYDDNGTIKYDEVVITITEAALSGVDLAQQNLFHGPFEI